MRLNREKELYCSYRITQTLHSWSSNNQGPSPQQTGSKLKCSVSAQTFYLHLTLAHHHGKKKLLQDSRHALTIVKYYSSAQRRNHLPVSLLPLKFCFTFRCRWSWATPHVSYKEISNLSLLLPRPPSSRRVSSSSSLLSVPEQWGVVLVTGISFKQLKEISRAQSLGPLGDSQRPVIYRKGNIKWCKQPGRFLECVRDIFSYRC